MPSWIRSADDPQSDFPLENLPLGVFSRSPHDVPAIGIAIGDQILDLRRCHAEGLLRPLPADVAAACIATSLQGLMALGSAAGSQVRDRAGQLLVNGNDDSERAAAVRCLVPASEVQMLLPVDVTDFADFYASLHHALNVRSVLRPDAPLPANYPFMPLAYQERVSSIVVSGTPVRRPWGQFKDRGAERPRFAPTERLDYELELGFLIAGENPLGTPVSLDAAESRIFGVCLVNDWSARDVQAWESQPLGPFLSKSFATTLSPWVVLMDALAPFRTPAAVRPADHPAPLAYLDSAVNRRSGGLDVLLEVALRSESMRQQGLAPLRVGRAHFREHYWTAAQLIAHQASNGCNLRPGDLIASGTVSGPGVDDHGCLLEMTRRGAAPVQLTTGESRVYLEDGDEVIMHASCERDGSRRIGFGECRGMVVSAHSTI